MGDVFEDLRVEYTRMRFDESTASADPFAQFKAWFDHAVAAEVPLANAMTLATVSGDGQPSARVVLLKELDEAGFVFYTNYESRKAEDLLANTRACLNFWWLPLERQVRIEGDVEKVAACDSDEYFASRPRQSNLSGMASPQSRVVPSRASLEERVAELSREWDGRELVRPEGWGGYRLVARELEFWQGRADRLHDRVRYRRTADGAWVRERIGP